ncbi:MAG: hypothetical protein GY716_16870 [bacterium]|nr:hypothetical protein [bacterium]
MTIEFELNRYLFHECDVEGDEKAISESWPFSFRRVADLFGIAVWEFEDDEPYFALSGQALDYLPKAGMSVTDLRKQMQGSDWIAQRDPVSLEMSCPSDDSVPSGVTRRRELERMACTADAGRNAVVLEGLYLKRDAQYLALVGERDGTAVIAGLGSESVHVEFPLASSWRRLAWGVGEWLHEKDNGDHAV